MESEKVRAGKCLIAFNPHLINEYRLISQPFNLDCPPRAASLSASFLLSRSEILSPIVKAWLVPDE